MADIVLNGARLWEGTTVDIVEFDASPFAAIGRDITLIFPGGGTRLVTSADELVLDGEIITGPWAGWRKEERRVAPNIRRPTIYRNDHEEGCEHTEWGWLCRKTCRVQDAPQMSSYTHTNEDLLGVVAEVARRWFRVSWSMSRESVSRTFTNGRAREDNEVISTVQWYRGSTRTKRGARKQMRERGWDG